METRARALCGRLSGDPTRWDSATRHLPRRYDVTDALLVAYYALRNRAPERDPVAVLQRVSEEPEQQVQGGGDGSVCVRLCA